MKQQDSEFRDCCQVHFTFFCVMILTLEQSLMHQLKSWHFQSQSSFVHHCSRLHHQVPNLFRLVELVLQFERELKIYLDYAKLVYHLPTMFEFNWLQKESHLPFIWLTEDLIIKISELKLSKNFAKRDIRSKNWFLKRQNTYVDIIHVTY